MREIKFRGQRIDTKEWVYGDLIQKLNNRYILVDEPHRVIKNKRNLFFIPGSENAFKCVSNCQMVKIIPETVGQFTGRKDKNGKEIYEGDIIKIRNEVCRGEDDIDPSDGDGLVVVKMPDIYFVESTIIEDDCYKDSKEIVGNKYENPELLKEKKEV